MKKLIASLLVLTCLTGAQAPAEQPTPEPVEITEEDTYITGIDFNENETKALKFLQDQGITDKMALAVILGNIKQESKFHPNICEGGARVPYQNCHRGGYGLVQWTTSFRYWGLGNFSRQTGGDPSSVDTQLSYMVTETEWKRAKQMFVIPDKTMDYYMKGAYIWLGWGVYGNRGDYSMDYYNRLT